MEGSVANSCVSLTTQQPMYSCVGTWRLARGAYLHVLSLSLRSLFTDTVHTSLSIARRRSALRGALLTRRRGRTRRRSRRPRCPSCSTGRVWFETWTSAPCGWRACRSTAAKRTSCGCSLATCPRAPSNSCASTTASSTRTSSSHADRVGCCETMTRRLRSSRTPIAQATRATSCARS